MQKDFEKKKLLWGKFMIYGTFIFMDTQIKIFDKLTF